MLGLDPLSRHRAERKNILGDMRKSRISLTFQLPIYVYTSHSVTRSSTMRGCLKIGHSCYLYTIKYDGTIKAPSNKIHHLQ